MGNPITGEVDFPVGDKTYRLRLSINQLIEVEGLGRNLVEAQQRNLAHGVGQDEGDQAVTGLASNGLLYPAAYDLGELQTKPAYRVRIDWYCGLALFGGRAAARLRGVLS